MYRNSIYLAFHVEQTPIPIHSESRFYLATYDVTAEMLTASLQTIGNAAKKIISMIEDSGEQIEEGEGEQSPAPLAIPA